MKITDTEYSSKNYIMARVYVTTCKRKDGVEFPSFKILETATHRRIDLRFPRTVTPPQDDCYIVVKKDQINKDVNRDFPCYWVREIADILPLEMPKRDVSAYFEDKDDDEN